MQIVEAIELAILGLAVMLSYKSGHKAGIITTINRLVKEGILETK